MREWKDPKNNPPPEMELVKISGTDRFGKWYAYAMKKTYVKPPHKKMKHGCWRWVTSDGERYCDQAVEFWKPYIGAKIFNH